jgi:outer membrane protein assembly factor BamB
MNTTQKSVIFLLALILGIGLFASILPERAKAVTHPDKPAAFASDQDTTDVLNAVLEMNRRKGKPASNFRKGHVSHKEISDYLRKTEKGFEIILPHRGMTPSPTVYGDKVFLSGGFGSKAFFAFDALTGDLKWAIDLDDDGPSSGVAVDDVLVFNTESCTIFAVETETGEMLWSYWLGDPLMSTPTIANGLVFTAYPAGSGGNFGNFGDFLIQDDDFQEPVLPETTAQPLPQPSPTDNASGIQMNGSHVLICFDLKTGEIRWQKWIDGDIMSAPVAEEDQLYVATFPGTVYKLDQKTGEFLSAKAGRATSAPVLAGNKLFMSRRSDDGRGNVKESISEMSRDASLTKQYYEKEAAYLDSKVQSGAKLKSESAGYDAGNGFAAGAPESSGWKQAYYNIGQSNVSSLQAFQGSRTLNYRNRNYNAMGDELVCTDPESGKVLWKKDVEGDLHAEGGFLATPPLYAGGKIIFATLKGEILILDPDSGKELTRFETGEQIRYQPVVHEGRIYATTMTGRMLCYETGDKTLTGWPTWGANPAHTNRGGR